MAPPTVEQPVMVEVVEAAAEAEGLVTLWLAHEMPFQPGQFVMLWIPRRGEKPYTASAVRPGRMAVTVRRRGRFSALLADMKAGDRVGIRGPYGRGFAPRRPAILVAGGCGLAPLAPLKDLLPDAPLIVGARSACEIMFRSRFPDMLICTDDGSEGHAGFPTDLLRRRLEADPTSTVFTCGPEVMMRAVFALCETFRVECQAGLERYMKCGIGVCGQCACDDRLVCRDGPVFGSADLRRMSEFGRTALLKSGRRVTIQEYADWRSA